MPGDCTRGGCNGGWRGRGSDLHHVVNASRHPSSDVSTRRILPLRAARHNTKVDLRDDALQVSRAVIPRITVIVHFLDFNCPHRWRRLAISTRFGGMACRVGGLVLYPSRAQLIGLRGTAPSGIHAGLNSPPQRLQPLGRGGALHATALAFTLRRHALGVVA